MGVASGAAAKAGVNRRGVVWQAVPGPACILTPSLW